ncbi:hypothetical protein FJ872_27420 [Mesorhizobium sp. B2-5-9]|uniref:hypothetical protein n=1 Tax=Mesorhizobium sp. B2-5-9 TaxID=2589921 RepID=UPI00112BB242|nr:hypothetical protein [Mesorhizobium sp. B2-5-9]TPK04593.1 hypothetical protein FJ872_27420 [Mesorhizobium sp. B2-5-9]
MSSPADRVTPYGILGHIKGANTYGVSREKWGKMTAREKNAFRQRLYLARIKSDPLAYAEFKTRQNELRQGSAVQKKSREAWKVANRDKHLAYKRAYNRRAKARNAMMLNSESIYAAIVKAIPRTWPKHMRDDIAGMISLDVLENRACLDRVDHLVKMMRAMGHYLLNLARKGDAGRFGAV